MTAGTAVCNCDQPDTCLCLVEVKANGQTYTYEQKGKKLPPVINLHDKDGKGVHVGLKIIPKGCIDHKGQHCPSGTLYSFEDGKTDVIERVPHYSAQDYKLKYSEFPNTEITLKSKYNAVAVLLLLLKDNINGISNTPYNFIVNECKGKPLITSQLIHNGSPLQVGYHVSSFNRFVVYPKYSVKVGVMIGLKSAVDSLNDKQRKELMHAHKLTDFNYNNHHGWQEKTSTQSITRSLTITGFTEYVCGTQIYLRADSDKLVKEFMEYKNKLTFLNKAETAIDTASKLFSATPKTNKKVKEYPVGKLSFLAPNLIITGENRFSLDKTTNSPIMEGNIDIAFKPLIGIQFAVDLIQAFAAQYGMSYVVEKIRSAAESAKERMKEGKNAAYMRGEMKLVVKGSVNIGFALSYDKESKLDYHITDKNEAKLSISSIIEIEAAGKVSFAKGYFNAKGTGFAEGCAGLESRKATTKNGEAGLDLVFYHNGITVKFEAEAGFGDKENFKTSSPKKTTTNNNGVITSQSKNTKTANNEASAQYQRTWIVANKLAKKDSTYRISIT